MTFYDGICLVVLVHLLRIKFDYKTFIGGAGLVALQTIAIVSSVAFYVNIYDKLDEGFKYSVALVYGGVVALALIVGVAAGTTPTPKSEANPLTTLGVFSLLVGAVYYLFFLEL